MEVIDPVRGPERVIVPTAPEFDISLDALDAVVSIGRSEGKAQRVVLFVDSPTQVGLARVRAGVDSAKILVSMTGSRTVGLISARSPWRIELGFVASPAEVEEMFASGPPVVFVSERMRPTRAAAGGEGCRNEPGEAESGTAWVSGPIKDGRRNGLWMTVDDLGDLIRLDFFVHGCRVKTIGPHETEDAKRLRELLEETK